MIFFEKNPSKPGYSPRKCKVNLKDASLGKGKNFEFKNTPGKKGSTDQPVFKPKQWWILETHDQSLGRLFSFHVWKKPGGPGNDSQREPSSPGGSGRLWTTGAMHSFRRRSFDFI